MSNPYESPKSPIVEPEPSPRVLRALKILAVMHIVVGALFGATVIAGSVYLALSLHSFSGLQGIPVGLAFLCAFPILIGRGLWRRAAWVRIPAIVYDVWGFLASTIMVIAQLVFFRGSIPVVITFTIFGAMCMSSILVVWLSNALPAPTK